MGRGRGRCGGEGEERKPDGWNAQLRGPFCIPEPTARPARQPDLPLIAISERREVKVRGPLTPSSRHRRRTVPIRHSICQLFTFARAFSSKGFQSVSLATSSTCAPFFCVHDMAIRQGAEPKISFRVQFDRALPQLTKTFHQILDDTGVVGS